MGAILKRVLLMDGYFFRKDSISADVICWFSGLDSSWIKWIWRRISLIMLVEIDVFGPVVLQLPGLSSSCICPDIFSASLA